MQGLGEITNALGVLGSLPQGEEGGSEGGEQDQMEDAKQNYDVFIQNTLEFTSHSAQWLPRFEQ